MRRHPGVVFRGRRVYEESALPPQRRVVPLHRVPSTSPIILDTQTLRQNEGHRRPCAAVRADSFRPLYATLLPSSKTQAAELTIADLFWQTIYKGVISGQWEYIRDTANDPVSGPLEDVTSPLVACYEKSPRAAAKTLAVTAGSLISFVSSNTMGHPGPILWYMARVPDGVAVDSWKPSGNVWFKIDQKGDHGKSYPEFDTNMQSVSSSTSEDLGREIKCRGADLSLDAMVLPRWWLTLPYQFNTTLPKSLPNGNYLLRGEHIGLHIAGSPQLYLSCANLAVSGGGSGKPSPLVSFPGAYSKSDPGLAVNIYAASGPYQYPGPAVWKG